MGQFLVKLGVGVCKGLDLGPELNYCVELFFKFFIKPSLQCGIILGRGVHSCLWCQRDLNMGLLVITLGKLEVNFLELFVLLFDLLLAPL